MIVLSYVHAQTHVKFQHLALPKKSNPWAVYERVSGAKFPSSKVGVFGPRTRSYRLPINILHPSCGCIFCPCFGP